MGFLMVNKIQKYSFFLYRLFQITFIIITILCAFILCVIILFLLMPFISTSQFSDGIDKLNTLTPNISYQSFIFSLVLCFIKLLLLLLFARNSKKLLKNISEKDTLFISENKTALKFSSIFFFLYSITPIYPYETLQLSHIITSFLICSLLYLLSFATAEK